jgi:hypothetical protein
MSSHKRDEDEHDSLTDEPLTQTTVRPSGEQPGSPLLLTGNHRERHAKTSIAQQPGRTKPPAMGAHRQSPPMPASSPKPPPPPPPAKMSTAPQSTGEYIGGTHYV